MTHSKRAAFDVYEAVSLADEPWITHALHTTITSPRFGESFWGYCRREGLMTTVIEEVTCPICNSIVEACISTELGKAYP